MSFIRADQNTGSALLEFPMRTPMHGKSGVSSEISVCDKTWCPFDRYDRYDRCDRSKAVNLAIAERSPSHVHLIVPIIQTSKNIFFGKKSKSA